jgi:uncharacterized membrane protein (DUF485 family)
LQHHHLTPKDWDEVANDPEFRSLLRNKRRFIVPATIFFVVYYLSLPVSVGFFPDLMRRPVWGPVTLAFVFALSQFAMAWILLAIYLHRARAFDAQEARVVENVRKEFAQS